MRIKINKEKCSGCHLCEMVCSLFHLEIINTEKSAIHIRKDDLDTSLNTPILCRQCKKMKCLNGEKVMDAQERKKFIWNKTRAERCPFDALPVLGEEAFHCNLCSGNPQCVKVCTPGAIQVMEPHRQSPSYLYEIPSYAKASEGYPPVAKSAGASIFRPMNIKRRVTHSSTGKTRGLLRRRIK